MSLEWETKRKRLTFCDSVHGQWLHADVRRGSIYYFFYLFFCPKLRLWEPARRWASVRSFAFVWVVWFCGSNICAEEKKVLECIALHIQANVLQSVVDGLRRCIAIRPAQCAQIRAGIGSVFTQNFINSPFWFFYLSLSQFKSSMCPLFAASHSEVHRIDAFISTLERSNTHEPTSVRKMMRTRKS